MLSCTLSTFHSCENSILKGNICKTAKQLSMFLNFIVIYSCSFVVCTWCTPIYSSINTHQKSTSNSYMHRDSHRLAFNNSGSNMNLDPIRVGRTLQSQETQFQVVKRSVFVQAFPKQWAGHLNPGQSIVSIIS